jgi:hypothetical protein
MKEVKVGVDWLAHEGVQQRVFDLAGMSRSEVDDAEFYTGTVKGVEICPGRVAIPGGIKHVSVVRQANCFAGSTAAVEPRCR